ncbi:hypothetical protein BKA69DRAFT_1050757 [Paraphysoderma sedebokerense]|nr:hypothetical protein BKA69DRAFT_1050757 [Paraphysoderma sedebokerense]
MDAFLSKANINNPIPSDLASECEKCFKILNDFIQPGVPGRGLPPDQFIPTDIIKNAKGVAVLTVIKAGFLWAGRIGSGLVLAKLPNGSWSAPSAITTAGASFGGQIGAEVTDFVIILNTEDAVKAFSQKGNVTLGGSLSVAAGPYGRTAEVGGSVSAGKNKPVAAPVFSYSKSKGLFAGVSIEGSVIVERKDANAKFYKQPVTAAELLSGKIPSPPEAARFYEALNAHSGGGVAPGAPVNINQ